MAVFQIGEIHCQRTSEGGWHVAIPVSIPGKSRVVDFRFPSAAGEPVLGDALACLFLMPAMMHGLPLRGLPPISPRLAANLPVIQEIVRRWFPAFRSIPVEVDTAPAAAPAPGTLSFFSAGLDSWHTITRNRDRLSAVAYVHGFDVPGTSGTMHAAIGRRLRSAAPLHGVPFLEIETNYREHGEDFLGEYMITHGAALAAIGHFMSRSCGCLLTPSSSSYASQTPWGSSALLDPLWSGDALEVVYEGAEFTRPEKAPVIAAHPEILPQLIVCWTGYTEGKNCGRCEKCLRTMMGLALAGIEDLSPSFAEPLTVGAITSLRFKHSYYVEYWHTLLVEARRVAPDSPWVPALRRVLAENQLHFAFKALKSTRGSPLPPAVAAAFQPVRDKLWAKLEEQSSGWLAKRLARRAKASPQTMREVLWG
jgi:hypothetical protein